MKNLEKKDRAKIAPGYKQRHKPKPKIVRNSGFCPFLHCTALQGVCHSLNTLTILRYTSANHSVYSLK